MSRKSRLQSVMGGVTPALPDETAEAIVAPKGFPAQEWATYVAADAGRLAVQDVLETLMGRVLAAVEERVVDRAIRPYTAQRAHDILTSLVETSFLSADSGEANFDTDPTWLPDDEPIPAPVDAWASGCVPVLPPPPTTDGLDVEVNVRVITATPVVVPTTTSGPGSEADEAETASAPPPVVSAQRQPSTGAAAAAAAATSTAVPARPVPRRSSSSGSVSSGNPSPAPPPPAAAAGATAPKRRVRPRKPQGKPPADRPTSGSRPPVRVSSAGSEHSQDEGVAPAPAAPRLSAAMEAELAAEQARIAQVCSQTGASSFAYKQNGTIVPLVDVDGAKLPRHRVRPVVNVSSHQSTAPPSLRPGRATVGRTGPSAAALNRHSSSVKSKTSTPASNGTGRRVQMLGDTNAQKVPVNRARPFTKGAPVPPIGTTGKPAPPSTVST